MPPEAPSTRLASHLVCSRTGETAALDRPEFLSPAGAPWLVEYDLAQADGKAMAERWRRRSWTMWRYRELLPHENDASRVSLGEGGTPLVAVRRLFGSGVDVLFKQEAGNPTGSFKDRGLSMAVNRARELGAEGIELASAGNAALALTAYAAACGIAARVALPEDAPEKIVRRCREHGAEVLVVGRNLVEAGKRLAEQEGSYWNLSTLKEPYRVEGKKTLGLEIAEQLDWRLPDWILYPTGGGTGIVGMQRAFDQLETLGLISGPRPRFVAVQMEGCAPIVRAFDTGAESAEPWANPQTSVWGLRVPQAIGDFLILSAVRGTGGRAIAIAEDAIVPMCERAAREEGVRIGPEGAACCLALEHLIEEGAVKTGERAVIFQTGHPDNY